MVTLPSLAFAFRTAARGAGFNLSLGHAQQLAAAGFGYNALAAYQAAPNEPQTLDHVADFVPDTGRFTTRAGSLGLADQQEALRLILYEVMDAQLPRARVHQSWSAYNDCLRSALSDLVDNNGNVVGAIGETNTAGFRETYLEFEEISPDNLPASGEFAEIEIAGTITMEIDPERPYSGHRISVVAEATVHRLGRVSLGSVECRVPRAEVDWGEDHEDAENIPTVPLAAALAAHLELDLADAESLVDAEFETITSDEGLVYCHIFDFNPVAPPAVAAKLMARFGHLRIEVPADFFDQVQRDI